MLESWPWWGWVGRVVRRRELTDLGVSKCGRRCGEERKES